MTIQRIPILLFILTLTACGSQPEPLQITGGTMGTTYTITLPNPPAGVAADDLQQTVEERLKAINAVMSTYQPDSELSLFNKDVSTDWVEVSASLIDVIDAATTISEASEGGFDVTVGPLVNLWGFGPNAIPERVPSDTELLGVQEQIGYQQLATRQSPPALRKHHPELYADLSAIAKGYAVDQLAEYVESLGATDYLVDIGGELRVKGNNPKGVAWKIAIEKPVAGPRSPQQILNVRDSGMATSGDYRNYFEQDGQRYSHTIDPATGRPITHRLASVTVMHPSVMLADGFATAIMVLGPERGMALAEREQLAVYLLVKAEDGFEARYTDSFKSFLR